MNFKRIKLNNFLLPKLTIAYNVRCKSFTHSENKKLNLARKYSREVLQKTKECILFDPSQRFDPCADFIKNDKIILKLIEIANFDRNETVSANNKWIYNVFPHLDIECVKQSEKWSIEQKIFVLDIWYHNVYSIACGRYKSDFFHQTPKQYLLKLKQLTKGPILQMLFYFTCTKRHLQEDEEKFIFRVLLRELHFLTLAEASIFYKTLVVGDCPPRIVHGRYIRRICKHLHQIDLKKEPEQAVTDAVKIVRRLSLNVHNKEISDLQMKLIPLVKNGSHYLLTHIAQLGVRQKVFNPLLLDAVVERLMEFLTMKPPVLRLKEVERSLLLIATFRFKDCAGHIAKYCDEVQPHLKQSLYTKFPLSLIQCIAHLVTIGTVDHELIDWALRYCDDRICAHCYEQPEHFLCIDSFAKINLRDAYKGHILSDNVCLELKLKYKSENPVGFHHDVQKNFADIFTDDNQHVLLTEAAPHFNSPDFLFIYDKRRNKTVEIKEPSEKGKIIRASDICARDSHLVPVAFVTYTQRSLLYDDRRKIATGRFMMKLKQLELLGFKVVTWYLRAEEWKLTSSRKMREKLQKRLSHERIHFLKSDKKL